jgi:peptidyl-prolyl cis-trans isomerase A (cyclophilin A)
MKTLFQSALVAVLLMAAMTMGRSAQARQAPSDPAAASANTQFVKVTTTMGDLVFELDRTNAPKTVDNFLGYVGRGYYNGTTIHRVLKDHLIQGGGFLADTSAKPAGEPIVNESNTTLKHTRGTVAMARSTSGPNTATSQFFINTADNANLDKDAPGTGHAIFAKVVVGMPVVDSIRQTPVGPDASGESSRPINPIIILSARPISADEVKTAVATEARNAAASPTPASNATEVPAITDIPKVAYVQMSTTKGDIVLQLDGEKAPISTANFLAYVDQGFYNGLIFHRVMDNFMIQGGGFDASMVQSKKANPPIKNEYKNGLKNLKGTIAMARQGGRPDSASSQFFINVVDNPLLDEARDGAAYAVFGKVVAGMSAVDAIRTVSVGPNAQGEKSQPLSPITITSARRLSEAEAQKFVNQVPAGGH